MDFFQRQDKARRRTTWLLVYFALAILSVAATFYLVALAPYFHAFPEKEGSFWHPELFQWVMGVTLTIIALGSLTKIARLSKGGKAIAIALGGRPLTGTSGDVDERELQNIVEEMAIASGLSAPEIYILDNEPGINAFAAGFKSSEAVIGVTKGAMQLLTRDELQGMIAHEFSHILNGDMRLNMRLLGWIHGIMCIALFGKALLRGTRAAAMWNSESDLRKAALAFSLMASTLGVIVYGLGSMGAFFGRLMKSAVSRQREFLADAAAVQFTRNPAGLANALKKIGALGQGSRMRSAVAEEASHMFFGNALGGAWFGLLSTHPSLKKRIKLLDPGFDGRFPNLIMRPQSLRAPPVLPPPIPPPIINSTG
jgi:Zn-dependent protease with chaperone function